MYREALEILKEHPTPGLVETQLKYVTVYTELGDLDKAREYWQKCVDLDPEWSPKKLAQMMEIWHFDSPVRARLEETVAKAGYPVAR
jgi:tetratricopeptide (TPR) repeat protein